MYCSLHVLYRHPRQYDYICSVWQYRAAQNVPCSQCLALQGTTQSCARLARGLHITEQQARACNGVPDMLYSAYRLHRVPRRRSEPSSSTPRALVSSRLGSASMCTCQHVRAHIQLLMTCKVHLLACAWAYSALSGMTCSLHVPACARTPSVSQNPEMICEI